MVTLDHAKPSSPGAAILEPRTLLGRTLLQGPPQDTMLLKRIPSEQMLALWSIGTSSFPRKPTKIKKSSSLQTAAMLSNNYLNWKTPSTHKCEAATTTGSARTADGAGHDSAATLPPSPHGQAVPCVESSTPGTAPAAPHPEFIPGETFLSSHLQGQPDLTWPQMWVFLSWNMKLGRQQWCPENKANSK